VSGIAGIVQFDGAPVVQEQLDRMLEAMKSRGPHGRKVYLDGGIGLGGTLLRINPAADQEPMPLIHPNQRWVLAFDGRIDNRADLLGSLKIQQTSSDPISDGQIILAAYEKWGQACAKYLIGDYALAIWDRKEHQLFCVRDHFGVKPFYYFASDHFFLFASSPDAILAARKIQPELNEGRIADFLIDLEGQDRTSTFYQNLYRLPPAHVMIVKSGKIRLSRYWELGSTSNSECRSDKEFLEGFQELFTEAVRCRLGNPTNTAVSLSGGLDSSAIFGIARQLIGQAHQAPLKTSSFMAPQEPGNLETGYIQALLDQGGMQALTLSSAQVEERAGRLISQLENIGEPFDWAANIWRALYSQAQEHQIYAVLDGVDGDLLLADSRLAQILWRSGQFKAALGETLLAEGLNTYYDRPQNLFVKSLRSAFTPVWLRQFARKVRGAKAIPNALSNSIINPDFARAVRLDDRLATFRSHGGPPIVSTQLEAHRIALIHPNLLVAVERYDRVATAYSIDPSLVEFCLSLPWQLKTHRGWTKMAMRRMMEPILPPDVVWRKDKHHLGWAVNLMILKNQAAYFRLVLEESRESLKVYVDFSKLDQSWDRFIATGDDDAAALVWDAVALALWLRRQKDLA